MNNPNGKIIAAALILIVILGGGLRLFGLSSESLWNDELASWKQSNYSTVGEVLEYGSIPDTHPPLFQIILYYVMHYLGDSELHLRAPSAISGILSILAIYWLGQIIFSYREGLIAALLMSFLWVPIHYSQEARNYSLLILFSILSSAFWFLIYRTPGEDKGNHFVNAIGYIVAALLASYTHYYGLFLVVLQSVGGLILSRVNRQAIGFTLGLYVLVVVGYLPWIPSMLEQLSHTQLIAWIDPPKLTAFPAFISFTFNRLESLAIVVLLFFGYLFVKKVIDWKRGFTTSLSSLLSSPEFILGYWLIIPIGTVYIISVLWKPLLTQRNLLISLPAVYLLLARSITTLPINSLIKTIISLAFGLVPLYHMIFVMGYYRYPYKEQFREVVQLVVESEHLYPDAAIIGYAKDSDYFNYYFEKFGSRRRVNILAVDEADYPMLEEFIQNDGSPYFWYLAGHTYTDPELGAMLEIKYPIIEKHVYSGARIWLFEEQ